MAEAFPVPNQALIDHLLAHAVQTGDFVLKSGRRSTWFCDGKQTVCRSEGLLLVADAALEVIPDDHHPNYLHPGRTAAILLDDVGLNEPVALAAACLVDTQCPELEPSNAEVLDRAGQAVLDFRECVPRPGSERLLEDLLGSESQVGIVALAERLDHLRHAHLWGDLEAARAAQVEGSRVYLAMAERAHPLLARRYTHCCRTFLKKYTT